MLYDSLSVALEQLELEAKKLQPSRQQCNVLFDEYSYSTKDTASRILDAMGKATLDAYEIQETLNERAVEVSDIAQLMKIYQYKIRTLNRVIELVNLRLAAAKRNSEHCAKYLNAIREHHTNEKIEAKMDTGFEICRS